MSTIPEEKDDLIGLGPACWADLEAGVILRDGQQIPLSAREVRLLYALHHAKRTTRSYLSASALANLLGRTESADPDHCIEQAICGLRRKLGEVPHHAKILRGRRGFGYRLCTSSSKPYQPEFAPDSSSHGCSLDLARSHANASSGDGLNLAGNVTSQRSYM